MMYSPELVQALHDVDAFHKNLFLLFEDLVQCVKEKTYRETLLTAGYPEGTYALAGSSQSEFRRYQVFRHQDKFRFIAMLIKTHEDYLNAGNAAYKELCRQLERDARFPLLLACGVFEPRDRDIFETNTYARRDWTLNACLLKLQGGHQHPSLAGIQLGDTLTVRNDDSNPYWSGELTVSFHDLATMTDAVKLSDMAERLLKM